MLSVLARHVLTSIKRQQHKNPTPTKRFVPYHCTVIKHDSRRFVSELMSPYAATAAFAGSFGISINFSRDSTEIDKSELVAEARQQEAQLGGRHFLLVAAAALLRRRRAEVQPALEVAGRRRGAWPGPPTL